MVVLSQTFSSDNTTHCMTKSVYILYHQHPDVSKREDAKLIGVYSSQAHVDEAAGHAVTLPGFRDHPSGFIVDKITLDESNWADGFDNAATSPVDDDETSIKTTHATLRLYTDESSLDFISDAFEAKPTRAHLKGEPQNRRNPEGIKRKESAWLYASPLPDDSELEDHISHLLGLLEKEPRTLESIRDRITSMDIFCMYSSENGQGSAVLDAKLIQRLAKQNIDVVFDLYPPN